MKAVRSIATIFMSLVFCGGCSIATDQDPMKDQPQSVREGVPPDLDKLPPAAKPIPTDALRIDSTDFFDFSEGTEGSFVIKGRVLKPDVGFDLTIENLADFPNARIEPVDKNDPREGVKFLWTPSEDFTGSEYGRSAQLHVRLTTTEAPILSIPKTIKLFVTRKSGVPEIVSVEDLTKTPIREGEKRTFKIVVRDRDGVNSEEGRPKLFFFPNRSDTTDISGLIRIETYPGPVLDPNVPFQWIFEAVLDTTGREITRGEEQIPFAIGVVSRFGSKGASKYVGASFRTSVREPVTSWTSVVRVYEDEDVVFNFLVHDLASEGIVSVNFLERPEHALGQATWDCPPAPKGEPVMCTIRWRVPIEPDSYDFEVPMELRNKSPITGDREETVTRVIGKFRVRRRPAAPSPTPTPSPTPPPAVGAPIQPKGGTR